MMKRAGLAVLLLSWVAGAGAAGLDESQVPAAVNWVVHFDNEGFQATPLGALLREHLESSGKAEDVAAFAREWGFDPVADLRDVTLCGLDRDCGNSLVLLRGTFNRPQTLSTLRNQADYAEIVHGPYVLYRWFGARACGEDPGRLMYGCFYRPDLIVMSASEQWVLRGLAVLNGTETSLAQATPLGEVTVLGQDAFMVAGVREVATLAEVGPKAAVLQQTQNLTLAVGANEDVAYVDAALQAVSSEAALNIRRVLEGLRAFALMQAENKPQLARLADGLSLNSDAAAPDTVYVTGQWPMVEALDFMARKLK